MSPGGDLAVVIPARNESDRIGVTVTAAARIAGADLIVVVDDGSDDDTGRAAAAAGATVVRHARNRGKGAALETGAEAVLFIEAEGDAEPGSERATGPDAVRSHPRRPRHLLFLDADLGDTAAQAGPLADPVRAGTADVTIAVFAERVKLGGHGIVLGLAGAGIERATGWRPAEPLNGQRCLTREAFEAVRPLASGWGAETGMTIDLVRRGFRITQVSVPLAHRATGKDFGAQLHRASQLLGVARALAARQPWRRAAAPPPSQHLPAAASGAGPAVASGAGAAASGAAPASASAVGEAAGDAADPGARPAVTP